MARNLFADTSIYPLPLFPGNTQNWIGAGRSKTNSDIGDIKIDYSLSAKNNFVGRFSIGETDDSSYDAIAAQSDVSDRHHAAQRRDHVESHLLTVRAQRSASGSQPHQDPRR